MRRWLKIVAIVLGVTLLVGIGWAGYQVAVLTVLHRVGLANFYTDSMETVSISIGKQEFTVPKAYIELASSRHDGEMTFLTLIGSVPDFSPYSNETRRLFDELPRSISYSLSRYTRPITKTYLEDKIPMNPHDTCQPGAGGIWYCPYRFSNDLVLLPWNGRYLILECSWIGSVSQPFCRGIFFLVDGVTVAVFFPRQLLLEFPKIAAWIYRRVCAMHRRDSIITPDHCSAHDFGNNPGPIGSKVGLEDWRWLGRIRPRRLPQLEN